MSQALLQKQFDLAEIAKKLVTEDDEPVDNIFSAKQQRLLVEPLYTSWTPPPNEETEETAVTPRPFLADANVGIFFAANQAPLIPDMLLSLDVQTGEGWNADERRSYLVWEFGKVPEVVIEVVSNKVGAELGGKWRRYAQWGINYYVVFDPFRQLGETVLCVYEFGFGKRYRPRTDYVLPTLGLSLSLWEGRFEDVTDTWVRWCDQNGQLIPTGREAAQQAAERAFQEAERAVCEAERAAREAERAERAEAEVAQLRAELERLRNNR